MYQKYIYSHKITCLSPLPYGVGQPMADQMSYKKVLRI